MTEKEKWQHIFFKGEYPDRQKVFTALKLQDVIRRPDNIKNSIYDELWHMTGWQNIVLNDNEPEAMEEFKKWNDDITGRFPKSDPENQEDWDELVESFLGGLTKALSWSESPEKLEIKDENNFSIKDSLYSLAMHNAYHIGKIVALRQLLGLWPPAKN